jgi:RHS repeat-associated protein
VAPGQTAPESKGWIGERYDADAGLQYLNARYYDPVLGMFLQPDWFEVLRPGVGTNRFSYSHNDPVNKLDPMGNQDAPSIISREEVEELENAGRDGVFTGRSYADDMKDVASAAAGMVAAAVLPDVEELLNDDLTIWDAVEVVGMIPVGKVVGPVVDGVRGLIRGPANDLSKMRSELGLPPAGSALDKSTLAVAEVNGQKIYGINAHGQPVTGVNAISATHAEIDVLNQIKQQGLDVQGQSLTLHVDRMPCAACGSNGGMRSMVEQLGLRQLTVVGPTGTQTILPR